MISIARHIIHRFLFTVHIKEISPGDLNWLIGGLALYNKDIFKSYCVQGNFAVNIFQYSMISITVQTIHNFCLAYLCFSASVGSSSMLISETS